MVFVLCEHSNEVQYNIPCSIHSLQHVHNSMFSSIFGHALIVKPFVQFYKDLDFLIFNMPKDKIISPIAITIPNSRFPAEGI